MRSVFADRTWSASAWPWRQACAKVLAPEGRADGCRPFGAISCRCGLVPGGSRPRYKLSPRRGCDAPALGAQTCQQMHNPVPAQGSGNGRTGSGSGIPRKCEVTPGAVESNSVAVNPAVVHAP